MFLFLVQYHFKNIAKRFIIFYTRKSEDKSPKGYVNINTEDTKLAKWGPFHITREQEWKSWKENPHILLHLYKNNRKATLRNGDHIKQRERQSEVHTPPPIHGFALIITSPSGMFDTLK